MAKKLTKPIALFFTVFAVLVAALLHFGALDITTSAAWDGKTTAEFGGDGSEASPFVIANGEQLARLAQDVNGGTDYEGKFFKLTADIDLGGKEWTPIGGYYHCFKGTFDGDGHTVSNFTINSENTCTGLFGKNNGTIMNLGVENAEINGYNYAGGVCGFNDDGCTIQNCYSTGAVSGNSETSSAIGGVCGCNNEGTITNCYYNKDIFASSGIGDGEGSATGLTSEELCNIFGNDEIWQSGVYSGDDSRIDCTLPSLIGVGEAQTIRLYNFGTSDSTDWQIFTEITTADQFMAIGNDNTSWGKNYVLGANIDLGGEEITPIGDSDKPFTGKFDGNGHTVSNFIINLEDECTGLFGFNNGTIMNLGVKNAEITGNKFVGGVCGYNSDGGTIKNCYNTGAVSGTEEVGGVCGVNFGTIKDCYNTGAVSGTGETSTNIGGVCGYNDKDSTIEDCCNKGTVSGINYIGGVCGYSYGSTIKNCYNEGTVSGTEEVGGVCGRNIGTIKNCYNEGTVSGNGETSIEIGGVCGYNTGTITNSYNIGNVSSTKYVGGVCGLNGDGNAIQNCYNTGAVKGESIVGGVCGYGDKKTITNCYYNTDFCTFGGINGCDVEGSATELTTEQLCSKTLPTGFGDVWEPGKSSDVKTTEEGSRFGTKTYTYPSLNGVGSPATSDFPVYNFGTSDSPDWQIFTKITTKDEFKNIGNDETSCGKNYVLSADIDLGGEEITPIGDSDKPFTGKFDGNGHTVSNFIINLEDECIGLFGKNNGTIMNLGVKNAEITGYDYVGGVCGENNGTIKNCYNTGAVSGNFDIGGVCGCNSDGGTIQNCYNTGAVKGEFTIGGVCGYNNTGCTINNCYNTGTVNGNGEDIGGVCGLNGTSTITNSYNIGNVSGTGYVGGVCGYSFGGTITNNYNIGNVSGTDYVGGVCGFNSDGGTIQNCYYNKDIFASGGIGGGEGSATGLTTLQMTDVNALDTIGFEKTIWEKKANDTKNGIAYYPSLRESDYQPSVEFTKKLELELVGDKTPAYGDKIEFRTKALITFINASGGEDITDEYTAGGFEVKVGTETLSVTDNKFEYTAETVGEVKFTLVYNDSSSDYFPEEYSEDAAVTIEKKELTAADFTFKPAADLKFDKTAKEVTVTAILDGVGEITVKYYSGDNEAQPINLGVYTVKIDVAEGEFCKSAQDLTAAGWKFTITKRSSSGGGNSGRKPTNSTSPTIGGLSKSWSDIAADLAKLANGSEVTIQLNGNASVPVEVIKEIDNRDLKVHFTVDSSRSWFVNGAEITVPAAADLSFIRTASQKHDGLRGIEGTQFRINNTGVPSGLEIAFKSEHAGKFANLYKSVDGKLVFVTCAKLGADGKVLLPNVTEKGDYIVMLCEFSDLLGDMTNDGVLDIKDALETLKHSVGMESGANPLMADFNGDGNVNVVDAYAILKRIVGLI